MGLAGECAYEIDIENGPQPAYLIANIPTYFGESETHEIQFEFQGSHLNQTEGGDFRIMALYADDVPVPLLALDLSWTRGPGRFKTMNLDTMLNPQLWSGSGAPSPTMGQWSPVEIVNPFDDWVYIRVKMVQSSGPGINDGIIELWVEGTLVDSWSGLYLDWPNNLTPAEVSYGVVDIFDQRTSGKLWIIPHSPSPGAIEF